MATRTTVINDPVGIHARPAAQFSPGRHRLRLHRHHRQGRRQPGSGRLHPVHHGPGHQAGRFRGHRRAGRRRRNRGRQPAEHPRQRRVIFLLLKISEFRKIFNNLQLLHRNYGIAMQHA